MKIGDYEVHPAAELFPMMADAELKKLAESIATNGQRETIKLWNGAILDGRNRATACIMARVTPRFETLTRLPKNSPAEYTWELNGERRHMPPKDLAIVGAKMTDMFLDEGRAAKVAGGKRGGKEAGKGRPKASPGNRGEPKRDNESTTRAAKLTGASRDSIEKMRQVRSEAPEVFEAAEANVVKTVADAARVASIKDAAVRAEVLDTVTTGLPVKAAIEQAISKKKTNEEARFDSIMSAMKRATSHADKLNNELLSILENAEKLGLEKIQGFGVVRIGFELLTVETTLQALKNFFGGSK